VGFEARDITQPADGVLFIPMTGTSLLRSEERGGMWILRESYKIVLPDGNTEKKSQVIAKIPGQEYVRATKLFLMKASERRLDSKLEELIS
jgi:hypothetical protein